MFLLLYVQILTMHLHYWFSDNLFEQFDVLAFSSRVDEASKVSRRAPFESAFYHKTNSVFKVECRIVYCKNKECDSFKENIV